MVYYLKQLKRNRTSNPRWTGLGLLFFYVFIYLIPPGLIPHSEHDHLGSFDSSLENDPCHIAIYHPWAAGACHHKNHISQGHENCLFCHETLVRQIIPETNWTTEFNVRQDAVDIFYNERTLVYFSVRQDSRGPPTHSFS